MMMDRVFKNFIIANRKRVDDDEKSFLTVLSAGIGEKINKNTNRDMINKIRNKFFYLFSVPLFAHHITQIEKEIDEIVREHGFAKFRFKENYEKLRTD